MGKIAALSTDLIRELDRLYPEKCPDPNWNDRKALFAKVKDG